MKNKISWNYFNSDEFVSGGMDKKIYLWDCREKNPRRLEFINKQLKVKHIQYSPHCEYTFAAGCNDGTVRIWDKRITAREKNVYSPHMRELAYLEWHPTVSGILLSGGHNIFAQNTKLEEKVFNIQQADPVSKCTWIPDRQY